MIFHLKFSSVGALKWCLMDDGEPKVHNIEISVVLSYFCYWWSLEYHRKMIFICYTWNSSWWLSVKLERLIISPSKAVNYWALHMWIFMLAPCKYGIPQFSPILTWINSSHDYPQLPDESIIKIPAWYRQKNFCAGLYHSCYDGHGWQKFSSSLLISLTITGLWVTVCVCVCVWWCWGSTLLFWDLGSGRGPRGGMPTAK